MKTIKLLYSAIDALMWQSVGRWAHVGIVAGICVIAGALIIDMGRIAYTVPTSASAAPQACAANQLTILGASGPFCATQAELVKAFAFDQVNAPCPDSAALMFADPDEQPKLSDAGRMICAELSDLFTDHVNNAVHACAYRNLILAGVDTMRGDLICVNALELPNHKHAYVTR